MKNHDTVADIMGTPSYWETRARNAEDLLKTLSLEYQHKLQYRTSRDAERIRALEVVNDALVEEVNGLREAKGFKTSLTAHPLWKRISEQRKALAVLHRELKYERIRGLNEAAIIADQDAGGTTFKDIRDFDKAVLTGTRIAFNIRAHANKVGTK